VETLFYVRHGTSEFNLQRRFGGTTDIPLAATGFDEARIAAKTATGLTIDCIVSSPLTRCRLTAEIIADQIGYPAQQVILSDLLVERAFGPIEGVPMWPEADIDDIRGVEPTADLLDRAWRAHEWLSSLDACHVLVCSHGAFGRALRSTFHPDMPFTTWASGGERPAGIPHAVITCWRRACGCCDHHELETF
jgi:uncharacterized phosphatase